MIILVRAQLSALNDALTNHLAHTLPCWDKLLREKTQIETEKRVAKLKIQTINLTKVMLAITSPSNTIFLAHYLTSLGHSNTQ